MIQLRTGPSRRSSIPRFIFRINSPDRTSQLSVFISIYVDVDVIPPYRFCLRLYLLSESPYESFVFPNPPLNHFRLRMQDKELNMSSNYVLCSTKKTRFFPLILCLFSVLVQWDCNIFSSRTTTLQSWKCPFRNNWNKRLNPVLCLLSHQFMTKICSRSSCIN